MSLAFWDPPDSGVIASPRATGASASRARHAAARASRARRRFRPASKAAGSYSGPGLRSKNVGGSAGWPRPRPPRAPALGTLERRGPLLDEGHDALDEVVGAGQRVLELGLEVELAIQVRVEHLVEGLLRRRVGAGGALSQMLHERARLA